MVSTKCPVRSCLLYISNQGRAGARACARVSAGVRDRARVRLCHLLTKQNFGTIYTEANLFDPFPSGGAKTDYRQFQNLLGSVPKYAE